MKKYYLVIWKREEDQTDKAYWNQAWFFYEPISRKEYNVHKRVRFNDKYDSLEDWKDSFDFQFFLEIIEVYCDIRKMTRKKLKAMLPELML